jgi:hypothetical protein
VLRLNGYFDESGTHAGAPVIVVAGYVAPERGWRRLEIKWKKVLTQERADHYHAKDLMADPPRGIYEGWSRKKADKLTGRLVPIVAELAGRAYGVHVLADNWRQAVPLVRFLPNIPHKAPYMLLAKNCIETVVASQPQDFKEEIGFVFARNEWTGGVFNGYDELRKTIPRSSLMGQLVIADPVRNVMLQVADLVAFFYRRVTEIRNRATNEPAHRINSVLDTASVLFGKDSGVFRYIARNRLGVHIDQLIEKHGPEWGKQIAAELQKKEQKREARRNRGEIWRRKAKTRDMD